LQEYPKIMSTLDHLTLDNKAFRRLLEVTSIDFI
jgi:hypothetical protein